MEEIDLLWRLIKVCSVDGRPFLKGNDGEEEAFTKSGFERQDDKGGKRNE